MIGLAIINPMIARPIIPMRIAMIANIGINNNTMIVVLGPQGFIYLRTYLPTGADEPYDGCKN